MDSDDSLTAAARQWLLGWQTCVRAVDYVGGHRMVADEIIAFGTYAATVTGRDAVEREQWRHIWPTIRDFTFRLDEMRSRGTGDALCVIVPWDSLGNRPDGTTVSRPGRATILLVPRDGRWVAVHTHFSLAPPLTAGPGSEAPG